MLSINQDRTVCKNIKKLFYALDNPMTLVLLMDNQNNNTITERPICDQMGINLVDILGDKMKTRNHYFDKIIK